MKWSEKRKAQVYAVGSATVILLFGACTKSIRIEPDVFPSALSDSTRQFDLHMKNGTEFVSRKASVTDSVVVITSGYQIQTDPWRQMDLLKPPITLSLNDVEHVSEVQTPDRDNMALVIVLASLAILLAFGIVHSFGSLGGGS